MPQEALSMRKIKEVLRLNDLGLRQQEIARSCSIAQSSVHRYLERASAAGLCWPLPEDCDDRRLNELLFPAEPTGEKPPARAPVDFAEIHRQLQSHLYLLAFLLTANHNQATQRECAIDTVTKLGPLERFCLVMSIVERHSKLGLRSVAGMQHNRSSSGADEGVTPTSRPHRNLSASR